MIDWNFIFSIVNALGSIATFLAFLLLFRKDKDKQTQLNKLTEVAKELAQMKFIENEKLNLSVKPELRLDRSHYNGTDGEMDLTIENIGERAELIKFNLISDDIILHNEHLPYILQKGETRKIFSRTKGEKHIKDCAYEIEVYHHDKINNLYISTIKGQGIRNKLIRTILKMVISFM